VGTSILAIPGHVSQMLNVAVDKWGMILSTTFNDFVRSGTAVASAPVDKEEFVRLIEALNAHFGLRIEARDDAFELLQDRIRVVAGRYWAETQAVDRKTIVTRVTKLALAVRQVKERLAPVRGGLHETADLEVVQLLSQVIDMAHQGKLARPMEQVTTFLDVVERLDRYCDQALAFLVQRPAKKGQRGLLWYDELVRLMVEIAVRLGVKVSTAGDRSSDHDEGPYLTPFTALVSWAETLLPTGAQSETLAACAKRIERNLEPRKSSARQKSAAS
jgi:hypothetical protein